MIYRHKPRLSANVESDGWAHIRLPGSESGIALDPILFAIWSAANGHTLAQVMQAVRISEYLASCALAILERAGLLQKEERTAPSLVNDSTWATRSPVSVAIIHQYTHADLEGCVASVLDQKYPNLAEITVISTTPVAVSAEGVRAVSCIDVSLARAVVEQLAQADGEAILLLDSRVSLSPGALAEMVRALELRDGVAAVAARVMWKQWPSFVVQAGDWRSATEPRRNPYAGCLDVGQFERWQESPAMSVLAGLVGRAALDRVGLPDAEYGLDWLGAAWCYQARLRGYHVLTAWQAVAFGPWPGAVDLMQETRDKLRFAACNLTSGYAKKQIEIYRQQDRQCPPDERDARQRGWAAFRSSRARRRGAAHSSHSDELLNALAAPESASMLRQGQPALTVDNARAVYGQYPSIAPLPIRRRIVFIGSGTDQYRALAHQLSETCEVNCVTPGDDDAVSLRQLCVTADLVVVAAEPFERFKFLHCWHEPILVDSPPLTLSVLDSMLDKDAQGTPLHGRDETVEETPKHWIQLVDGVLCANEGDRAHWLEQFELVTQTRPYQAPWQAASNRDSLLMVVPTPRDGQADEGLMRFCQQPYLALDRQIDELLFLEPELPPPPTPLWALPVKVWQTLREKGGRQVRYEMRQYIRWKIGI